MRQLVRELTRRNVYKVAVAYVTVAFVGFQAAKLLIPSTVLPSWTDKFFLFLLIIGCPVALVLAWAFEMMPEGGVALRQRKEKRRARPSPLRYLRTSDELRAGLRYRSGSASGSCAPSSPAAGS